jgi:hypothetical protein
VTHSPRAFPWEQAPPVGTCQGTRKHNRAARARRPRSRNCLRKGCKRKYKPRCRIQRYCQEPECLRQVRRWQAARRQAERRKDAHVRARRAEAEKVRRQQTKVVPQGVEDAEVTAARGHADEIFFASALRSAWLPRTPRDFGPQPGTLLLARMSSSRSKRQGP